MKWVLLLIVALKDIAKVVLILEKSISGLKVIGLDYDKALKTLQNEFKLLENDRVVIDAKGLFWFYFISGII